MAENKTGTDADHILPPAAESLHIHRRMTGGYRKDHWITLLRRVLYLSSTVWCGTLVQHNKQIQCI